MTYDENTKVSVALENPDVVKLFEELAPGFQNNPMLGMAKGLPLKQVFDFLKVAPEKVKEILAKMNELKK